MSVNKQLPVYEEWCVQKCPLCGSDSIVIANGVVFVNDKGHLSPDRGYSFCNCRNIFFTDWSNITQSDYVFPAYAKAHYNDGHRQQMKDMYDHHLKEIQLHENGGKKVLDLGSVTNYLLDEAKTHGYKTTGLDICDHEGFGHDLIVGDFDSIEVLEKFDIIYSNHFFEHIHYPLQAMKKCYDMLTVGGLLFISMPDPFQIDWGNHYAWGNFVLRQHYIMWDMDSFCEEMERIGFSTIFKRRNYDVRRLRDYHLLFKK